MKAKHYSSFRREVEETLKSLKRNLIHSDSKEFEVTLGVTPSEEGFRWDYQTGSNSFSGGAYSHSHWVCLYLTRRSSCRELSKDAVGQLKELLAQVG